MRRHELTDEEWAIIQPLLPNKVQGAPRGGRQAGLEPHPLALSDGRAQAGRAGVIRSAHHALQPLRPMAEGGVWDRILDSVSEAYDGDIVMIDSACVRVHQHGAAEKREIRRPP